MCCAFFVQCVKRSRRAANATAILQLRFDIIAGDNQNGMNFQKARPLAATKLTVGFTGKICK